MNNTLVKGMALLEALARSEQALGITALASQLGIGKSNVHRLLQALVELGYVRHDPASGRYAASIRLWELGSTVLANLDLRRLAEAPMRRLLEQTRENVHLSLLDGDDVVYVHKLDSPQPVRTFSSIGGRAPAYAAATGKAILAWQNEAQLESLSRRLARHSPTTIVDPEDFLREMAWIRNHGYAVSNGEWREGVRGLAAPVREPRGGVIAAIGISGPTERLRATLVRTLAPAVIAAADEVSAQLEREGASEARTQGH